jgi:AcrR family transcriptional regulator
MVTAEEGHGRPPPRRRLPAAERREAILRAAADVFAQAGYRAARMSEVAARTGVTEPVVFQNFGSKAALFAAVIERAAAELRARLEDAADAGPADGLLAHVLSGHAPWQRDQHAAGMAPAHDGAAYGVLFTDAADLADDPELAGPARDAVRAVAAHLADLVRRSQAGGGVRPDADPGAVAWLLLSVLSARRLRAAVMPADLEPAVTALILDVLAPPANGADPGSASSG